MSFTYNHYVDICGELYKDDPHPFALNNKSVADLEAGEHKHHWDQPNHDSKQLQKVDEYKGMTMIFGCNLSVCVYTQSEVISTMKETTE